MRYGRYLKLEKNIAASDTGGILERWRYGRTLLTDPKRTHPNGRLKHGELAKLVTEAKAAAFDISDTEIQRRMQAARAYETEAEVSHAVRQFGTWHDLVAAGFPQVELPDGVDPGEPYDPHAADRKPPKAASQEPLTTSDGKPVPEFSPRIRFGGDEHGPRSTIEDLYGACKESEGYTDRMIANDAKRRAYVDDLASAVGGDLTKTWYEAEARMRGLGALGVTDWDSLAEIMDDIWRSARDRDRLARLDDLDPDDE